MRTLIYVPIIHTSADLGSLAGDVTKRGLADLGKEIWREHIKTVDGFWDTISFYFDSIEARGKKIYQDGMVADGEVGEKIIEEGVRSGSKNYDLVSRLLKRGAVLVKTENFNLVEEERDKLFSIIRARSTTQKLIAFVKYNLIKNRLLSKRDKFISKRVDETLDQGETGIIFIGAYHDLIKKLPGDIQIREIKDTKKIKEYQSLLPFCSKRKERFEELGGYLISKVEL